MRTLLKSLFFLLSFGLRIQGDEPCLCGPMTEVSSPCFSGGLDVEGAWIFFRPIATDADLEYGSLITLTGSTANLNALLLEVEPSYQSAYQLSAGYSFPCSNQSLNLSYLSAHFNDSDKKKIQTQNQLIQNFLGASYSISQANSKQKVDQVGLSYSLNYFFDQCLELQPYLGIAYADIRRDLDVKYTDLVLNPLPSSLTGKEKSTYWGVGPFLGTEFLFPLFCNFGISGNVGAGVLFGKVKANVASNSLRDNTFTSFFDRSSDHRAVTILNGNLSLFYSYPIYNQWGLNLKLGYTIDYYFKAIDRINPFNGYVNNPNTFPVKQSSNLGLGGPYVLVSLEHSSCFCNTLFQCPLSDPYGDSGPYVNFTSSWLEPTPTNEDLVYAILTNAEGKNKNQQADPKFIWAGSYELGYRFCHANDLQLRYFHLDSSDRTSVIAKAGEGISSVNASGPSNVVFSQANSQVKYRIDQFDGTLGKYMQFPCCLNLHGSMGLRYLRMDRQLTNRYLGGEPPLTTESKSPILKSRFRGIGPVYTIRPDWNFFHCFSIVGQLSLTFLVGELKATLDQMNFGLVGQSSNDLRTPKTPYIVPVFDGQAGIKFNSTLFNCVYFDLEGGYQYSEYYRGIRLLLPTLLTGLEQINSNLRLPGPYFKVGISSSF